MTDTVTGTFTAGGENDIANSELNREKRNDGRLVFERAETPASELAQRNVIHSEEEHRQLGAAILAGVQRETGADKLKRLVELDANTPLFDFEEPEA